MTLKFFRKGGLFLKWLKISALDCNLPRADSGHLALISEVTRGVGGEESEGLSAPTEITDSGGNSLGIWNSKAEKRTLSAVLHTVSPWFVPQDKPHSFLQKSWLVMERLVTF